MQTKKEINQKLQDLRERHKIQHGLLKAMPMLQVNPKFVMEYSATMGMLSALEWVLQTGDFTVVRS